MINWQIEENLIIAYSIDNQPNRIKYYFWWKVTITWLNFY